jgi:hypothetical protein
MLRGLIRKYIFLGSAFVAMFCLCSGGEVFSQSLEQEATVEENIPTEEGLTVKYVATDMDGALAALAQAESYKINLQIQDRAFPNGGGSVEEVEVSAIHNGEKLFFYMTWSDATKNDRAIKHEQFRDAVGLMFPIDIVKISPQTPFSPRMGDRGKPVNIWHWKADWERDLHAEGGYEHMEDVYPNMFTDFDFDPHPDYFNKKIHESVPLMAGGIAAGSMLSTPRGRTVEDLNAIGFGTLTAQTHQDVNGTGYWSDGKWHVMIYRSLITPDGNDVRFVPGQTTFFNAAVWNGEEGDRNGLKSVSIRWRPITLEPVKYTQ